MYTGKKKSINLWISIQMDEHMFCPSLSLSAHSKICHHILLSTCSASERRRLRSSSLFHLHRWAPVVSMATSNADSPSGPQEKRQQYVVVMRHGDRIDSFEPLWVSTAARPWDPPLIEEGRVRAFCAGRKIRTQLGFPIHRVFVSPFLRCIQTAAEAVSALCAVDDDPNTISSDGVSIDPSKLKVSFNRVLYSNLALYFDNLCLDQSYFHLEIALVKQTSCTSLSAYRESSIMLIFTVMSPSALWCIAELLVFRLLNLAVVHWSVD